MSVPYFALLDDAVSNRAMLFTGAVHHDFLSAEQLSDLDGCLQKGWQQGWHVLMLADYEFGLPLQQLPESGRTGWLALHWFANKQAVDAEKWLAEHASVQPSGLSAADFQTSEADYHADIERIHQAIARGETYQINYTTRLRLDAYGDPVALYRRLRQPVPYAALAYLPQAQQPAVWTLCFSPELFLRIAANGDISTEPMKGTAPVSDDPGGAERLRADPKNRAENIMIVDLLRNDLGKIADIGSVRVPEPFAVNQFGTVWQMSTAVHAHARAGTTLADLLRATFPCGSITGAPKRMSMQLIQQWESSPRGLYTGSIGHLEPSDDGLGCQGTLNVVIRTLQLMPSETPVTDADAVPHYHAEYGVGSGIVWDSDPAAEYQECGWKARFLSQLRPIVDLFESILVTHGEANLLPLHLQRLLHSARALNIPIHADTLADYYRQAIAEQPREAVRRLKITLFSDGRLSHQAADLTAMNAPQTVLLAPQTLPDQDYLRRFKTTRRSVYDLAWQEAEKQQAFDSLFFNRSGYLLEGGRSNVFVLIDGCWYTPSLDLDILNGVMRQAVLADPVRYLGSPSVQESRISLADVQCAERIVLSNALRGAFAVRLATAK